MRLNARIVCASNRNLDDEVRAGRFREDLLYRINVLSLDVPPLRDRPEDVLWLLDRYFGEFVETGNSLLKGVSSLAEDAALAHRWPGNVRELRNRVERAVDLALGEWLMPADLFPERVPKQGEHADAGLAGARAVAERVRIERALRECGHHLGQTAKVLGISRTTLREKMRRYGLATHS